jgi:hypothetical protein
MPGEWIELFNGKDLTGWRMRHPGEHKWIARDGVLDNTARGIDIITEAEFGDFDLHIEYNMPKDSNSGIYLRGRYEIQLLDSVGKTYSYPAENGAIYAQKRPDVEATKPAGEWQTFDITLKGMNVTVVLNGVKIHDNAAIKGPTGGQLFNDDGPKGPLMLQGDHGPIRFRNIRVREL